MFLNLCVIRDFQTCHAKWKTANPENEILQETLFKSTTLGYLKLGCKKLGSFSKRLKNYITRNYSIPALRKLLMKILQSFVQSFYNFYKRNCTLFNRADHFALQIAGAFEVLLSHKVFKYQLLESEDQQWNKSSLFPKALGRKLYF